ncbi:hypothetical protein NE237_014216 [Protea cynaroides]|uniref:Uncharacterized protein n=1 Tax=Protea cynaroides TaxID=273540 RepID=A0A9Q0JQS6_9MAGN|nr:hypothetical protein NE237_014216 [Protea cynaroides]
MVEVVMPCHPLPPDSADVSAGLSSGLDSSRDLSPPPAAVCPNLGSDIFPPLNPSSDLKPCPDHLPEGKKSCQVTSFQASFGTASGNGESALNPPLDGDEAAGNSEEGQPKVSDADPSLVSEMLDKQEDHWTLIRARKMRSAGSPGLKKPTRSISPSSCQLDLSLEQVAAVGKSTSLTPQSSFPPKNPSFLSGVSFSNSRSGLVSAAPGPSYFGCLAAVEDQARPVLPIKPSAPPAPAISDQSPPPCFENRRPIPLSGPKTPSSSAGHTPFPPRRPVLSADKGPTCNSPLPVPWIAPLYFQALLKSMLLHAPPPLVPLPLLYPLPVRELRSLCSSMRGLLLGLGIWVFWVRLPRLLTIPNVGRIWV